MQQGEAQPGLAKIRHRPFDQPRAQGLVMGVPDAQSQQHAVVSSLVEAFGSGSGLRTTFSSAGRASSRTRDFQLIGFRERSGLLFVKPQGGPTGIRRAIKVGCYKSMRQRLRTKLRGDYRSSDDGSKQSATEPLPKTSWNE